MIIYKATNTINGKVYIGQTTQAFGNRKQKHKYETFTLNKQYHFHKAIRRYGWDAFNWCVIDTATNIDDLNQKEEFWIKEYRSTNSKYGYNIMYGGNNRRMPAATKKKISTANKGRKFTDEHIANLSACRKGRPLTMMHRLILSAAHKGRVFTEEHSRNKSIAQLGERNPGAKLTREDVIKIKHMINDKIPDPQIAKHFNCSYKNIWMIRHEHTWKQVTV